MNELFFEGKYSMEDINQILEINARPHHTRKFQNPFYKKSATEFGPTWAEKKEFVHFLINDSTISPQAKVYLQDCENWVPKYQLRGFKYGLTTSMLVFFFMPVVRKQPFVRRLLISQIPMVFFLRWGYVWGHENYWRRVKEVTVTYEIFTGSRSKWTMK